MGATVDSGTVSGWVRALCEAPDLRPESVAAAIGADIARAQAVGPVLSLPPLPGTGRTELVRDPAKGTVDFADVALAEARPLVEFITRFGVPRQAPRGPHQRVVTMIFDRIQPAGAPRSCALLARVQPDSEQWLVGSVALYPHPPLPEPTS
jgi:hypothetical protein